MVRTRFAPSPTGYLHIGGVRTALFNWLFTRRHGGQFLLRIDDTDQQRNVEAALAPILHGFRWLGIDWDEGPEVGGPYAPYFQSQRLGRYQAAVQQLLANGAAYYDYARPEELKAEREAAEREKRTFRYSRRWMARSDLERRQFESEGRSGVVRLLMHDTGTCEISDHVRGQVSFDWASEQDHVVQRADGTCLYHLASVVDDFDFEITHVIRAEEHLSNTPRQIFIAQALGYPLPQYAHLPYVAEPGSKEKLSKRKLEKYLKNPDFKKLNEHGQQIARRLGLATAAETFNPVIVDFYEQTGYLPQAILNYLVLLGWSLDDKTEMLSLDEMIANFSLERVNKAPASFDPRKLFAFQERYMQQLPLAEKATQCLPFAQRVGWVAAEPSQDERSRLQQVLSAAGDRIKTAGDVLDFDEFFTADETMPFDEAALEKHLRNSPEGRTLLQAFRAELAAVAEFEPAPLESLLHSFVTQRGIKPGQLVQPLRLALTGKTVGCGLFDTLAILGRDSSLRRIDRALLA